AWGGVCPSWLLAGPRPESSPRGPTCAVAPADGRLPLTLAFVSQTMRTKILPSILRHAALFFGASLIACASAGCAADSDSNASEPEATGSTASISFDAWEKSVAREVETGNYIVNGDQVLTSVEELRAFYEEYVQSGALILHRANGADAKWNNTQK